jgi:hypothetical protein
MIGIGGKRAFGLSKYLPAYGWNATILTQNLPGDPDAGLHVVQTHYEDVFEQWKKYLRLNPKKTVNESFHINIKKDRPSLIDHLLSIPIEIITYPDRQRLWYHDALLAGEKIIRNERIDAILSTSPPVTSHLVAKTLAEKYHIPWVADFRDLWSQNHYLSYSFIRNYFERKLEVKTIRTASAVTTVSQPLADKLALLHRNKKIFSITNGFDPELINTDNTAVDQSFNIVYTGVLYKGKRDPTPLFVVMNDLSDKGCIKREDIKIDFFGSPEDWIQEDSAKYHLQEYVTQHGLVTHETAIAEQRKAQLLLLLTWDNPEEKGVYTGKLFEYLAARRPILSFGHTSGEGVIKELLVQTHAGVHAGNMEELTGAILGAYHEYKESGIVTYRGIDAEVMKFSHQEMAKNFADVLDNVQP